MEGNRDVARMQTDEWKDNVKLIKVNGDKYN